MGVVTHFGAKMPKNDVGGTSVGKGTPRAEMTLMECSEKNLLRGDGFDIDRYLGVTSADVTS